MPSPRIRSIRTRKGPWIQAFDLKGWEWNTVELAVPDLPPALEGVRMIHLSDLHLRERWPRQMDEMIARANAAQPDLILFTGDFVDDKRDHRPALANVTKLITALRPSTGFAAILGNHDGDLLAPRLHALGVRLITHQRVEMNVRGAPIELIGFPGPDRLDLDERFIPSLPPRRAGVPRIILSHYPDLIRAARPLGADLYLAGHTHGGQMCLPNGRALMTHDSLPRHMCKGAHDFDGTCLIVSRGFGYTTIPIRLFCPAEVVEIRLVTGHSSFVTGQRLTP
jgi:predicted MPP superfamily phosphohydrolase